MSKLINLKPIKVSLLFMFLLMFMIQVNVKAAPSCDCEDPILFPEQDDVENCIANNLCDGIDVPVNGNVWILAAAGMVLFVVREKFFKKRLA